MAVFALIQSHAFCSAAAATSHAIVLPLTPTPGNTIILTVVSNATVAIPTGYSLASSAISSTGTYIFYKIAGASEASTINLIPSSIADIAVRAYEYSGLAASAVFDKQASATPAGTVSQSTISTGTLSQANEFCIAVYGYPHTTYASIPVSWSGSFRPEGALFGSGTDQPCNATATQVVTSTTALTVTATVQTPASGNSICLATFKMAASTTTFIGKPSNYVDSFGHFETSADGTVVTNAILASAFSGAFSNRWVTISAPDSQTAGPTPGLTISSGAAHAQDKDLLVEGASFPAVNGSSFGLRATQSANNCIQLSAGQAADIALGMHFRWTGAQIDNSPRDIVSLRSDPTGNYQFIQCLDGANPSIHVHWQPTSGTGIGSEIYINKGNWYWLQITHVPGGGTCTLNVYDAQNNYVLVGSSVAAVTGTDSIGATTIQVGQIKYAAGASQYFDFDNITLSLDGTTPTTPTTPLPLVIGTGSPVQATNTTVGVGVEPISGAGASVQSVNLMTTSASAPVSGGGVGVQVNDTAVGSGVLIISGNGSDTQTQNLSSGTGVSIFGHIGAGASINSNFSTGFGNVGISGSGSTVGFINSNAGTGMNEISATAISIQRPNTSAGFGSIGYAGPPASGFGSSTQASAVTLGIGSVNTTITVATVTPIHVQILLTGNLSYPIPSTV